MGSSRSEDVPSGLPWLEQGLDNGVLDSETAGSGFEGARSGPRNRANRRGTASDGPSEHHSGSERLLRTRCVETDDRFQPGEQLVYDRGPGAAGSGSGARGDGDDTENTSNRCP